MQEPRAKFGITRTSGTFKTVLDVGAWSAGATLERKIWSGGLVETQTAVYILVDTYPANQS